MSRPPRITSETFEAAETLAGVCYDDEERKLLLEGVRLPLAFYEKLRALPLDNVPPALRFDPRLSGSPVRIQEGSLTRSPVDPGPLPESDEDVAFAPVVCLSRWIERRELTSQRLTDIYLDRLARFGPGLECVVTRTEERARVEARRADAEIAAGRYRGPLHGVPWGAKDLLDTAGIRTTWGSRPFADRIPEQDAEVVRRLGEAGAVLVAKLSLGELAQGDEWYGGRTRNPWQPERGSGGSSAGSGAATAAGLVGFALGSETLGSISNPAMQCGVTGLRPTFGRVARSGAMALAWSLDKLGPLTRGVEDAALVLDAIRGAHPGDPDSLDLPFPFDAEATLEGLRVGFVPAWFRDPWASACERASLERLREAGLEVRECSLPRLPYASLLVALQVEAAAAFADLTLSGRDDELRRQDAEGWPNAFRLARLVSAVEYVQMLRVRTLVMQAAAELFQEYDLLVGPGMGSTLSFMTNATGHPALTLPVGFGADGIPRAVTLHGRLYDEATLCRVGLELERHLDFGDRRPDLRGRA
jgi:Asp-tRNA(Asn)/Glu-tRNA(Gln) amidotransferase A subunit family amidase